MPEAALQLADLVACACRETTVPRFAPTMSPAYQSDAVVPNKQIVDPVCRRTSSGPPPSLSVTPSSLRHASRTIPMVNNRANCPLTPRGCIGYRLRVERDTRPAGRPPLQIIYAGRQSHLPRSRPPESSDPEQIRKRSMVFLRRSIPQAC